jgi:isopenicillin-N epimerase
MTEFGRAIRPRFLLEPGVAFLNHGSFGTVPRDVAAVANGWRERLEANPDRFMRETLPGALREAAGRLARFIGARAEDVVFVDNATAGVNAVLRSLHLAPGDEILTTDHAYGAVLNAVRYAAARAGAIAVEAPVPMPAPNAEAIFEAVRARFTARTKLLVIDHITSATAMIFPVERLTAFARARGVRVLIDGAHAPGHLALDVPALGADWYVGNCHKWLFAPRACALLWARRDAQGLIKPLSISHGYGRGFLEEFDWTGTRDPAPFLSAPAGLEFLTGLGAERVRQHNRELALAAARRIAQRWGEPMNAPPELLGAMACIRLPARWQIFGPPTRETAKRLWPLILARHRIVVAIMPFAGALWARISAQVYNEMSDYDGLVAFAEVDPPAA